MNPPIIKNKGIMQTFYEDNNNHHDENQLKWDANYNGQNANLNVDIKDNGKKKNIALN